MPITNSGSRNMSSNERDSSSSNLQLEFKTNPDFDANTTYNNPFFAPCTIRNSPYTINNNSSTNGARETDLSFIAKARYDNSVDCDMCMDKYEKESSEMSPLPFLPFLFMNSLVKRGLTSSVVAVIFEASLEAKIVVRHAFTPQGESKKVEGGVRRSSI